MLLKVAVLYVCGQLLHENHLMHLLYDAFFHQDWNQFFLFLQALHRYQVIQRIQNPHRLL